MAEVFKIITKNPKAFYVHIKDLVVDGRARKEFTQMEGLRASIAKLGLIQPIVVLPIADGKYRLLAGERRYRCCLMLGAVEIPAVERADASELEQKEVEYDENFHRAPMTWQEQASLYKMIDTVKRQQNGDATTTRNTETWNMTKTAALVGENQGQVSKKIELAKAIETDSVFAAKVGNKPWTAAHKMLKQDAAAKALQQQVDTGAVKLATNIRHGDARTLITQVADLTVDMLLWDPPFGQGSITELIGRGVGDAIGVQTYLKSLKPADNLSLPEAVALIGNLAPQLFRVMKPGAYFAIFMCSQLYQPLCDILTATGFEFDPCPIIWDKGRATAPGRGYNYAPSYEPILLGVKPPWSRRLTKDHRNIITFAPLSTANKRHAFQKPPELLNHLITQCTDPGMVVFDPSCGSGATVYAAEDAKRSGLGFELDAEHYTSSQVWGQERKQN